MNQQARFDEQRQKLEDTIRQQSAELQRYKPNILVVGRAGVGKSMLINMIVGEKLAKTGAGRPITQFYTTYPHPLLNLTDSMGWEGGSEGDQRFRDDTARMLEQHRTTNAEDHIHIVWYVIAASDARFTDYDAQLVRDLFGGLPVLFVLTKCDIASASAITEVEQAIKSAATSIAQQATKNKPAPRIAGIVQTSAEPLPVLSKEPWGMVEVVQATRAELPAIYRDAFDAAQSVDFSLKARKAQAVVAGAVLTAGAIGASPIPFSDSALLIPLQMGMVSSIGLIYGFGADPASLTKLISGSVMPLAAQSVGVSLAANLAKMVPGPGSVIGGMIDASVAASLTGVIGYSFQRVFHQLALRKAKGQTVTLDAAADFLRQALPQMVEEARARGVKNLLSGGGTGGTA